MLSATLYSSPVRRAKSPLGRRTSTRAYPASSPRHIPVAFVSLRRRYHKSKARKPITIRTFQRQIDSIVSHEKATVLLDDYGGLAAPCPAPSAATPGALTPTERPDWNNWPGEVTSDVDHSPLVFPLAINMDRFGDESTDLAAFPQPLAQRPFWMPPSSPGGLKPRYPPPSSQAKEESPSPLRKLRRSVVRIAKADETSARTRGPPRRPSIDSLEDSELPYARLRDSAPAGAPSQWPQALSRSSSMLNWRQVMPTSSSTLSDAGYAAQASRGRTRQISGRIQLTDQDIIEIDSNTFFDDVNKSDTVELPNVTALHLNGHAEQNVTPRYLRRWPAVAPSPLIDTSRTDITLDRSAGDLEDDEEDTGNHCKFGTPTNDGQLELQGCSDSQDLAYTVQAAGRCHLRSSNTFGPGTHSAFAVADPKWPAPETESFDTSLEVVELSCFALTTPSDDGDQPAVQHDLARNIECSQVIVSEQRDSEVDQKPEAVQKPASSLSLLSSSLKSARVKGSKQQAPATLKIIFPPRRVSTSAERHLEDLQVMPSSRSHGALVSGPVSSVPARSSFVPRPFLLSKKASGTSGCTSPSSPGAPRPLLLGRAHRDTDLAGSDPKAELWSTPTSLGLSLLKLARSSVSSSSTSRSKESSGLLSPPLSLGGYMCYSPPQSPDWTHVSVTSPVVDARHDSGRPLRHGSYSVLPRTLSTLTALPAKRASHAQTGTLHKRGSVLNQIQPDAVEETLAILDGKREMLDGSPNISTHTGAALHQLVGSAF
ncbi:hypothetical protein BCV69DRAFT_299005 [Microstroma glucosiphilum]|uniref:Uncharacterized protein n=1 Tax=Pseudomicrostroma glucosiphilum TaxID=1684307 RepID=A0A316UDT3_9BASI|nr:hypothetical protein BCV69DRAFT_299005 [Pseudomicrostroma glucosiphilum]PWN21235.1 hypothetical protein BCV69DRAFT_299005 [Pseudomicrostroma glucosiphilum]